MPDSDALPDLTQALADAALQGRHLYILADFAGLPDPHAVLGAWVDQGLCLLDRNADVSVRNVSPILIELDPARHGEFRLQRSVRAAEQYPVISWIESRLPAASLAMALQARLDAVLADEDEVLLAFYDPRILPSLLAVLEEPVRAAFCSIASRWWYLNRAGQLTCVTGQGEADCWTAPLRLNTAQQNALIEAAEPDAVMKLLRDDSEEWLAGIDAKGRHAWVSAQLDRARRYGIADLPALAQYCMVAVHQGDDAFDERSPWKEQLQAVKAGQLPPAQALRMAGTDTE